MGFSIYYFFILILKKITDDTKQQQITLSEYIDEFKAIYKYKNLAKTILI